jgi:hypothetical protein
MRKFLLLSSDNKPWVEAQENLHRARLEEIQRSSLIRRELYPALLQETANAAALSKATLRLMHIEAQQRVFHRKLMDELISMSKCGVGKKTLSYYSLDAVG